MSGSIVNGCLPSPFAVDKATNQFYNVPSTAYGAQWLTCPTGSLQLLIDHLHCPIELEHIFGQNGPSNGWSTIVPSHTGPCRKAGNLRSKVCLIVIQRWEVLSLKAEWCFPCWEKQGKHVETGWIHGWWCRNWEYKDTQWISSLLAQQKSLMTTMVNYMNL